MLDDLREKPITLVEIGVNEGGSLPMWRKYFHPDSRIIGIDLNPIAKKLEKDGFEIFVGDQGNPKFWQEIQRELSGIDVLIDDGGHTIEHQLITFKHCMSLMSDNSIVIIEDTHTSYMEEFGCPSPISFVQFTKQLIDGINFRCGRLEREQFETEVWSVEIFESLIAFHIKRDSSIKKSQVVNNDGKKMGVVDFRYANDRHVSPTDISKLFKFNQ